MMDTVICTVQHTAQDWYNNQEALTNNQKVDKQ